METEKQWVKYAIRALKLKPSIPHWKVSRNEPEVKQIPWEDIDRMPLADGVSYSLDCYSTKRNNNVLICGTPGSGKTRGIIEPQLMMATGSYVISDPKRNLYRKYKHYLEERGYKVSLLDFTDPSHSVHFNPLEYLESTQDILKLAHVLAFANGTMETEPFWDQCVELMLCAAIGLLKDMERPEYMTIENVCLILDNFSKANIVRPLDNVFTEYERECGLTFAYRKYQRVMAFTEKTLDCIRGTAHVKMEAYDTDEISAMLGMNDVKLEDIGKQKYAMFVCVSDMDRSMDTLANIFYDTCMKRLVDYADGECEGYKLPVPVRFLLDDFGTNVHITGFEKMIASVRSRGISVMMVVQADGQMENGYGANAKTIINSCDTYVYLGGLDEVTAGTIAQKCNVPLRKVLFMPVEMCWVIRRGEEPQCRKRLDVGNFEQIRSVECEKHRMVSRDTKEPARG